MKKGWKCVFLKTLLRATLPLACFLVVQSAAAQLTTGTILGTVKDQSEAVLPGATVKVTQVETGAVRSTVTGSRGEYRIPALAVGSYEVQVEMTGFQGAVRSGITLTIGREAVVDFTLRVGDVAQYVTVTGEAPMVETTTATVSGVIDPQQMRNIPLNARSFLDMVPLTAGATFAADGPSGEVSSGMGKKLSIVGTRFESNRFLLDGADMADMTNTAGSAAGTMAGVETVREFRVITNAYDAQYGRHTGGVVSAVTKSGTNEIHGSLFEFFRNDNLDAPRWEANAFAEGSKPEFKRNQFGGSVGGPMVRDRAFFFGSYEGLRQGLGRTDVFNVPGADMRRGILPFSAANCTSNGGQVLAGGKCQLTVNPKVAPFLAQYPLPNTGADLADGRARHARASVQTTDQDFWLARIDYRFSDSDSLFGRVNIDSAEVLTPEFNILAIGKTANRYATLEETHIYSPRLIGKTHFSFNRTRPTEIDIPLEGFTFPEPVHFGAFDDIGPGVFSVSGLTGWGGSASHPKDGVQNLFQFQEEFYFSTGRHSFKFGAEIERFQFNYRSDSDAVGAYSFGSLSDFLLNKPSQFDYTDPGQLTIRGWRQSLFGFYIQDDVQVRPGFTLNLGLRYEFITTPWEVNGRIANIRDITPAGIKRLTPETTDVGSPYFLNPSLKNFAPRVGFAWDVFQGGKTSLRGGIGLFHQQVLPYQYASSGVRLAPFYGTKSVFAQALPVPIDFPNAYTSQAALLGSAGAPEGGYLEYTMKQPKVIKWSLDIEQEIAPNTTLGVGYSGTRGLHLWRGAINLNSTPAEMRTHPDGGQRRYILMTEPLNNTLWGRIRGRIADGSSDYHGLRVTLTKRFSHGFQFASAYTFSKVTDDASAHTGSGDWGNDIIGYQVEKINGLSSFDVRNSFTTNFVYDLPGANLKGAAGTLLGGWSLSSILQFNSGYPMSLTAAQPRQGSRQMVYVDGRTLDLVPGGNQNPTRPQNPDQYFDVTQFSFPTPFFQGNLGRGTVSAPGVANIDFSLKKSTPVHVLGEGGNLEFQAQFFNLFNRPNFAAPARNLFDRFGVRTSNAGQITSTSTAPRQIQFAVRLVF